MIDFRYHLVSLVSVFMALAIGVVLGAGPLKEAIGDQLSNQVEGLRQDKVALQQAVANRDQQVADRDAFVDAVNGSLVAEQLGGTSVVLITLPGTDSDVADAVADQLSTAGAKLTGRVAVQGKWTDPDQGTFRKTLAGTQIQYVNPRPPASAGADGELAAVLARAVLTDDVAKAGQADTDAQTILGALTGGELVSVDGDPAARATLAVVLTGAPDAGAGAGQEKWTQAAGKSYLALLSALDAAGAGTVFAGPQSTTADDGLLAQLRKSDAASAVSTVDTVDSPMGRTTVVLALREQLVDGVGQYGFGDGASAPLPDLSGAQVSAPTSPPTGGNG